MRLHENRLLADESNVLSHLIFFLKIKKDVLWSTAVMIGTLRNKNMNTDTFNATIGK